MDTQTRSALSHRLLPVLVLFALSSCAGVRQVAADHPVATRVLLKTAATSAVLTTAKVIK